MRPTAIVPLLFTLGALILSLLCLFAGSKKGFLQNADLLTVSFPDELATHRVSGVTNLSSLTRLCLEH